MTRECLRPATGVDPRSPRHAAAAGPVGGMDRAHEARAGRGPRPGPTNLISNVNVRRRVTRDPSRLFTSAKMFSDLAACLRVAADSERGGPAAPGQSHSLRTIFDPRRRPAAPPRPRPGTCGDPGHQLSVPGSDKHIPFAESAAWTVLRKTVRAGKRDAIQVFRHNLRVQLINF